MRFLDNWVFYLKKVCLVEGGVGEVAWGIIKYKIFFIMEIIFYMKIIVVLVIMEIFVIMVMKLIEDMLSIMLRIIYCFF